MFMVPTTIVNGVYKPSYIITGGPTLYPPIYKVAPTPDTSGGNGPNIDVTSLIIFPSLVISNTAVKTHHLPIGSMYGISANIWGILMVNVTIYSIHGSYGL